MKIRSESRMKWKQEWENGRVKVGCGQRTSELEV